MSTDSLDAVRAWLAMHEDELLSDYRAMLRIPSVESKALPGAPFGKANRDALDFALSLGEKWGFATKNLEGFIGFAETGMGRSLVTVLGHLDVVPVGPGWKHEPFGAEIHEGYVYSRGAVDDKGPTMAAFYAARAIKECVPDLGARLRVVFGCDEESGFECVHHYVKHEEAPTFGVAPDSGWPAYHAEKGIATFVLETPLPDGEMSLLHAEGGQRPNIVIDSFRARVKVDESARKHVEAKVADAWDKNLTCQWEGDELAIEASGKAAHGAWPFGGDSAAIRVFRFLMEISPISTGRRYTELFEIGHPAGAGLGICGSDEVSRDLTSNLGIVGTKDGKLSLTINVRYPVTWKGEQLRAKLDAFLGETVGEYKVAHWNDSPSLYFPLDHPLIKTICDVYKEETGDDRKPGVMGGGTYARAVPNTVSIGTGWDGDGDAHQTDERLAIASLHKMARIYAHLLLRLLALPV